MTIEENQSFVQNILTLEEIDIFQRKDIIQYFLDDIDHEVKHDKDVKLTGLFVGVSSFLEETINLTLKGKSGIGKTYTMKKVLSYFPQAKIHYIAKNSATAFYHDNGILRDKQGKEINLDDMPKEPKEPKKIKKSKDDNENKQASEKYEQDLEKYKQEHEKYKQDVKDWLLRFEDSFLEIDLSNKILFFLDAEAEGFEDMLPLLSHDVKSAEFNITESPKGAFKTKHIKTKGFPVAIFAMTDRWMGKREGERATRQAFVVSPEETEEKIKEANKMQASILKWQVKHERKAKTEIKKLLEAERRLFSTGKFQIQMPFFNLNDLYPSTEVRDMRGFNQFKSTVEACTALHVYHRPVIEIEGIYYVLSTIDDVRTVLKLTSRLYENTVANADKALTDFYWKYCKPFEILDFTANAIVNKYNEENTKKTNHSTVYKKLKALSRMGYLDKQLHQETNRKTYLFTCLKLNKEETCFHLADLEKTEFLRSILEKGFNSFLTNTSSNIVYYIIEKNKEGTASEWEPKLVPIPFERAKELVLGFEEARLKEQ
jgi:hypothetical protein